MPNRLSGEQSPYLRQHMNNPVDWYPWGEEALARAKAEDKPILLSIGYAACHWCHVMAHECFENPEIAEAMNQHFINIKVDREERPDLDAIYMEAVVALRGQGGWPLTVFLTPEGIPFFGGTYFPPQRQNKLPGFLTVLRDVERFYLRHQDSIQADGAELIRDLREVFRPPFQGKLEPAILEKVAERLCQKADPIDGGFDGAPKFPHPAALEYLLRSYLRTHHQRDADVFTLTLDRMAHGGLFDHLGGGFHRYSVDRHWNVPHFEKMLYDNALLARIYLLGYQIFQREPYRIIAENTLDWSLREMRHPEGGFFASQDADSEGEEGKYYRWTHAEIAKILGDDAAMFWDGYRLVEGTLIKTKDIPGLRSMLAKLHVKRLERIPPGRDTKVIASWNGLLLRTLTDTARALNREDYLHVAEQLGDYLLSTLWKPPCLLRFPNRHDFPGYLDDYANVADGLLGLYEATFEERWIEASREIADAMIEQFWENSESTFYDTGTMHEALVLRPRELTDQGVPSGNASACRVLLKLGHYLESRYSKLATLALEEIAGLTIHDPTYFGGSLLALDDVLAEISEVALVGCHDDAITQAMLRVLNARYRPHALVAFSDGTASPVPFLQGRPLQEKTTAYLCKGQTCRSPIQDPVELEAAL